MDDSTIKKIKELAENNYEVRKLWTEHVQLDTKIESLQIHAKTQSDTDHIKQLQVQKLQGKDRLMQILQEQEA